MDLKNTTITKPGAQTNLQHSLDRQKNNLEIHNKKYIPETTKKIYQRFKKTYDKQLNQNNNILQKLIDLADRNTNFTILLENPPDEIF